MRIVGKKSVFVLTLFAISSVAAYTQEMANFHHVHINAVDPSASIDYYKKIFSAVPVKFRGVSDAVLTDRSFILFTKVDKPAPAQMDTALYHIGWGGVDGPSEFKWRDALGVKWETPVTALGNEHYMYAFGPDKEVIEVWTGFRHNRFGHVHLFSDDVNAASRWYKEHLNLKGHNRDVPKPPKAPADLDLSAGTSVFRYLWASSVSTEGVTINVFGKPSEDSIVWWNYPGLGKLQPTDGRAIDHIAFSFRKIEPVFDKMKEAGVEIVDPIKERPEYGFKSFFVRGPDSILIEIVEAKPIPHGAWD